MSLQIELNIGKDLQFIRVTARWLVVPSGWCYICCRKFLIPVPVQFLRSENGCDYPLTAERERLRDELQNYCAENFNVNLNSSTRNSSSISSVKSSVRVF